MTVESSALGSHGMYSAHACDVFAGSLASPNTTLTSTTWVACSGRKCWAAPGASQSSATSSHRSRIISCANNECEASLCSRSAAAAGGKTLCLTALLSHTPWCAFAFSVDCFIEEYWVVFFKISVVRYHQPAQTLLRLLFFFFLKCFLFVSLFYGGGGCYRITAM